jgi:hypothetical protein
MLSFPLLTPDECAAVRHMATVCPEINPISGHPSAVREAELRGPRNTSKLALLEIEPWLRQRMQEAFDRGTKHFGYDGIAKLHESRRQCRPRVARYGVGGEFAWHLDIGRPDLCYPSPSIHWLACSVLLTPGGDYEGGTLEMAPPLKGTASRRLGDVTVLMGHEMHRVSPVTKGLRAALIFWGEIPVEPVPESRQAWKARMEALGREAKITPQGPCVLDRFA